MKKIKRESKAKEAKSWHFQWLCIRSKTLNPTGYLFVICSKFLFCTNTLTRAKTKPMLLQFRYFDYWINNAYGGFFSHFLFSLDILLFALISDQSKGATKHIFLVCSHLSIQFYTPVNVVHAIYLDATCLGWEKESRRRRFNMVENIITISSHERNKGSNLSDFEILWLNSCFIWSIGTVWWWMMREKKSQFDWDWNKVNIYTKTNRLFTNGLTIACHQSLSISFITAVYDSYS